MPLLPAAVPAAFDLDRRRAGVAGLAVPSRTTALVIAGRAEPNTIVCTPVPGMSKSDHVGLAADRRIVGGQNGLAQRNYAVRARVGQQGRDRRGVAVGRIVAGGDDHLVGSRTRGSAGYVLRTNDSSGTARPARLPAAPLLAASNCQLPSWPVTPVEAKTAAPVSDARWSKQSLPTAAGSGHVAAEQFQFGPRGQHPGQLLPGGRGSASAWRSRSTGRPIRIRRRRHAKEPPTCPRGRALGGPRPRRGRSLLPPYRNCRRTRRPVRRRGRIDQRPVIRQTRVHQHHIGHGLLAGRLVRGAAPRRHRAGCQPAVWWADRRPAPCPAARRAASRARGPTGPIGAALSSVRSSTPCNPGRGRAARARRPPRSYGVAPAPHARSLVHHRLNMRSRASYELRAYAPSALLSTPCKHTAGLRRRPEILRSAYNWCFRCNRYSRNAAA